MPVLLIISETILTTYGVQSITYSAIAPLMLGFSTIGLWLFYITFRYNLLFVNGNDIDTKGLVYAKALQHTLVGCYLSVVCLIGLFAIKTGSDRAALGPLVLMIIFLIFMILYHISLNSAIEPLLHYLPRSLEAEEEAFIEQNEQDTFAESSEGTMGGKNSVATERVMRNASLGPAPHTKPSMIKKFLRPDIYTDFATMRRLMPKDFAEISYDPVRNPKAPILPFLRHLSRLCLVLQWVLQASADPELCVYFRQHKSA